MLIIDVEDVEGIAVRTLDDLAGERIGRDRVRPKQEND